MFFNDIIDYEVPNNYNNLSDDLKKKHNMKYLIQKIFELSVYENLQHVLILEKIYYNNELIGCIFKDLKCPDGNIIVVFRGTYTLNQLKKEIKFKSSIFKEGYSHSGVLEIYEKAKIKNMVLKYLNINTKLIIGGYSLGGTLSTLLGIDLYSIIPNESFSIYLFATPKIYTGNFLYKIKNVYNIQNTSDIIINIYMTALPFLNKINYDNLGDLYLFTENTSCYYNNHSIFTYFNNINNLKKIL